MNSEAETPHHATQSPYLWGQTKVPWQWPESRLVVGVVLSLLAHALLLTLQFDLAGLGLPDTLFSETGRLGVEPALVIKLEPLPAPGAAPSAPPEATKPPEPPQTTVNMVAATQLAAREAAQARALERQQAAQERAAKRQEAARQAAIQKQLAAEDARRLELLRREEDQQAALQEAAQLEAQRAERALQDATEAQETARQEARRQDAARQEFSGFFK